VVFVPVPEEVIGPDSPVWRLRDISPVIREDAADLGEVAREDVKEQPADVGKQLPMIRNRLPPEGPGTAPRPS
jgi:hypothetical protein